MSNKNDSITPDEYLPHRTLIEALKTIYDASSEQSKEDIKAILMTWLQEEKTKEIYQSTKAK